MRDDEIEALRQLFGAYFHQDWLLDAPDARGIMGSFLEDHREQAQIDRLACLIIEYATRAPSDELLEQALFKELGCHYMPSADGFSARDWVLDIAARMKADK